MIDTSGRMLAAAALFALSASASAQGSPPVTAGSASEQSGRYAGAGNWGGGFSPLPVASDDARARPGGADRRADLGRDRSGAARHAEGDPARRVDSAGFAERDPDPDASRGAIQRQVPDRSAPAGVAQDRAALRAEPDGSAHGQAR